MPERIYFKLWGGKRVEVIGAVEDSKYQILTEKPQPAMFYSFLQVPSSEAWIGLECDHWPSRGLSTPRLFHRASFS